MARTASRRRRKLFVRQVYNSVAPVVGPAVSQLDLLNNYRVAVGVDLNLPEFTIWRFRIKVSIRFSVAPATTYTAASGVLVAAFCDDKNRAATNPVVGQYEERYLIWDWMYASDAIRSGANGGLESGTNSILMYKEYDVRSHARLRNLGDTLILVLAPSDEILDFSIQTSILCLTT